MSATLKEIAAKRREMIRVRGHEMGVRLPGRRTAPVIPFGRDPFLICEIKRSSPSKGPIAPWADAVAQAWRYAARGILTLSVLTEEEHFSGSLADLVKVKQALPHLCLLRKDFLLDEEDIQVSYRAGADAVLLIARLHDLGTLSLLYKKAKALGMEVLFEVHDGEDLVKARHFNPSFTGFNSRDLATFKVDPVGPVRLLSKVDWKTSGVYESGIGSEEDARFALSAGFSGLLVGEAVMREIDLVGRLRAAFSWVRRDFWLRLYAGHRKNRPLVKICGITRAEDAALAAGLGADILGFILAPSPRRADPELLRDLGRKHRCTDTLKVGVVVGGPRSPGGFLDPEVAGLLEEGFLDALQLHGDEEPEDCSRIAYPHYKALRIRGEGDIERAARYRCPRVLADAYVSGSMGGTGKTIPDELVHRMRERFPLWLAGGIGPTNVMDRILQFRPELVDASSLLEASPGTKDPYKMKLFFEEIDRAADTP